MKRDGYESDKNDIIIIKEGEKINLTAHWDGTVNEFHWSNDGASIYFIAPINGTVQLFEVHPPKKNGNAVIEQLTNGQFDVHGIVGQAKNILIVKRRDMNHATELYTVDLKTQKMAQLTFANAAIYSKMAMSKVEKRMVPTTDGKEMVSWVIYPPKL